MNVRFDLAVDFYELHDYVKAVAWNDQHKERCGQARIPLLVDGHDHPSVDPAALAGRVIFVHSHEKNACLQECILALARGRWRSRLRGMLKFALANDNGSGLDGGMQESLNLDLTEAALCASHFKVLVVEACTTEEILSGCCSGVWTMGPECGHVLGTIAWLTVDMHAVALSHRFAKQFRNSVGAECVSEASGRRPGSGRS